MSGAVASTRGGGNELGEGEEEALLCLKHDDNRATALSIFGSSAP